MLFSLSTGLVCAFLALSAASYLFHKQTIEGVQALGLPDYLRNQIAVLKVLAIPALLLPGLPNIVREWAYAGVALFLLTAIVAHAAHRDPVVFHVINALLLGLLFVSRSYSGI